MEDPITNEMSIPRQKRYFTKNNLITIDIKDHNPETLDNKDKNDDDPKEFIDYEIKSTENRILDRFRNQITTNKWASLKEIYDDEFQILIKKFDQEKIDSKLTDFKNMKIKVSKTILNDLWSKHLF